MATVGDSPMLRELTCAAVVRVAMTACVDGKGKVQSEVIPFSSH